MYTIKRFTVLVLALVLMTAILAPAVATATASYIYRTLEYGDSGSDVKELQRHLKKLGYFHGNIGGNYLDLTQRAVKNYERAYGHKVTNYCSQTMQKKILKASESVVSRTLHYGDSGEDVKKLQKALRTLGYFDGNIGGNYLKLTRAAVKAFERDYGYKQTSYCTVAMQNRIRRLA